MTKDKLKKIIVLNVFFIIIVIILLMFYPFKKNSTSIQNNEKFAEERQIEEDDIMEKYECNEIEYQVMSEQGVVDAYFYDFLSDIDYPKDAFNSLDDNYKSKRFENNINLFKEYLQDNEETFLNAQVESYLINKYDEYTEYVIKDQYENYYVFKVFSAMDYKVELDTYTLDDEKFISTYNKADVQKKVSMSIDKFFKMINAKDYHAAYKTLHSGFKNNYFQTEEEFKEYMKNNLFEYNKMEITNFSNEGTTYMCTLKITDKTGESKEEKEFKILMQLKENTDFIISFTVEE